MPVGTSYTVIDSVVSTAGYITKSDETSGTIENGQTSVASFVNNSAIATGNLTVSKTVPVDQGDRKWSFRMERVEQRPIGVYGGMPFADGTTEFTLKHGGIVTTRNLPRASPTL